MKIFQKQKGKDFIILNLTDPQLGDPEWAEGHPDRKILEYTISELVERAKPDLITISGDLAWAGYEDAYDRLADLLDTFQTPWAIVWGNHDNQNGAEHIQAVVGRYSNRPLFVYEQGNPELGNGNYVICIEEGGRIVEGLIMMDSHDKAPYADADGERQVWAKLTAPQIEWYRGQVRALKSMGCESATLILHIPIHAYETASKAAYRADVVHSELTPEQADGVACWNAGYEESTGVQYENISCYPEDDGVFAAVQEEGLTKRIIAGHDHICNWMITYHGVQLIYALKTGQGCYWDPRLNGGTVLKVGENGVYAVEHVYVDATHIE